jgi:hypothetical protein
MEEFRLIPPDHNYYVYALIDPRDNQIFYIGKGKNQRYKAHRVDNLSDGNSEKIHKIREIRSSGNEVRVVKLLDYLNEDTSFKIEEILIYNLGRTIFEEGILTNFIKGGNIYRTDNLFYNKELNTDILKNHINNFNSEFLSCTVKSSKIKFLHDFPSKKIFEYDIKGSLINIFEIEYFFNLQVNYNLFNHFSKYQYPVVFCNKIYSTTKMSVFYKPKYFVGIGDSLYDINFLNLLETQIKNDYKVDIDYHIYEGFIVYAKGPSFKTAHRRNFYIKIETFYKEERVDFLSGNINIPQEIMNENLPPKIVLSPEEIIEKNKDFADWEKKKILLQQKKS